MKLGQWVKKSVSHSINGFWQSAPHYRALQSPPSPIFAPSGRLHLHARLFIVLVATTTPSTLAQLPASSRTGWPWNVETDAAAYAQFNYLPRITIITPSYQQGGFIEETLRSVLLQNYPKLEFLVADGGSQDQTVSLLEQYSPWLTWWVSERDKGTADANNKCLARMTGDYWLVLNSDDTLEPNALLGFVRYLNGLSPQEREQANWITSGIHVINERSEVKAQVLPEKPAPVGGYTFAAYCWIYHPCTFLSKAVYERFGGFSMLDLMDYAYWIQMELAGFEPRVVPEYWAALRFHTDCKSADFLKSYALCKAVCQRLIEQAGPTASPAQLEAWEKRLAEWDQEIYKGTWQSALYENDKPTAALALAKLLVHHPRAFMERWFWGTWKRWPQGLRLKDFSPHAYIYE